jgi:hypothetical protein
MKLIFSVLLASVLLSCSNENDVVKNDYQSKEPEPSIFSELEEKEEWYKTNLIPQNDLLIAFSYSPPTLTDNTDNKMEFKKIRSYENKISSIKTKIYPDSIVAIFFKRQKKTCEIKGNILITSDNIILLFNDICSPFDHPSKRGEFYKFKYVIQNTAETKNKIFIAEQKSLLKK